MSDVRDIMDFLSVCQDDDLTQMERGEKEARSQKRTVIQLDYLNQRETDRDTQVGLTLQKGLRRLLIFEEPVISELRWPLDHPCLRIWRQPLPERRGRRSPSSYSAQDGEKGAGEQGPARSTAGPMIPISSPMVNVLIALRLPLIAQETDPTLSHAIGSGSGRRKRIILRKGNLDLDKEHAKAFTEFFQKRGVSMKGAFPLDSRVAPPATTRPFWLRRQWKMYRFCYLNWRCIVKGCSGCFEVCPFVPEGHDCLFEVAKRVSKRVIDRAFSHGEHASQGS